VSLVDLRNTAEFELAKGVRARVVTASTVSVMHVRLDEGAVVPEHSHYHEQVVNVVEGELELTVEGTPHSITPGKAFILKPNIPHSARAVKATFVVDVFHPVREEFARGDFKGYGKK
jgi:quercetin dioxygenase-like cupin family protein